MRVRYGRSDDKFAAGVHQDHTHNRVIQLDRVMRLHNTRGVRHSIMRHPRTQRFVYTLTAQNKEENYQFTQIIELDLSGYKQARLVSAGFLM